jgi:DNA-binding transcriptional ArsR family regulator
MDLARAILLELEKCPFTGERHDIVIEGCAPEDISYHILLLYEAGFIDAERMTRYKGYHEWKAKTITWHGHEFLESSRDPTRWEKAKDVIKQKGAAMTLDALKTVLTELVHRTLAGA